MHFPAFRFLLVIFGALCPLFGCSSPGNGGDGTYTASLTRTVTTVGDASTECTSPSTAVDTSTFVVSGNGAMVTVLASSEPPCVLYPDGDDIGGGIYLVPSGCAGIPASAKSLSGFECFDGVQDCDGSLYVTFNWKPAAASTCLVTDTWTMAGH